MLTIQSTNVGILTTTLAKGSPSQGDDASFGIGRVRALKPLIHKIVVRVKHHEKNSGD